MKFSNLQRYLLNSLPILKHSEQQDKDLMATAAVKVLFICMGNICRSPMAEGLFKHRLMTQGLQHLIYVDSAGTHSHHIGAGPDQRGQNTAARRGVDLSTLKARQVKSEDLELFDHIVVMDNSNYRHLTAICQKPEQQEKISLLMSYAPQREEQEVPDPYYGSPVGFERVMDLLEDAIDGLFMDITERHGLTARKV